MPQSIFISYVYEDKPYRDNVERWFEQGKVGPNRVTIAEFTDFRQHGDRAVETHLKPMLRGAAAVLCLVGQNTHNSQWVQYELSVASSLNKKIILARIPGTTGAAPPHHQHLAIHPLDPSSLLKLF